MGVQHSNSFSHWNYFLALEEDLDRLSRFVDFSHGNDATFSLEIARLLLGASSEVDVVLKQLAKACNPASTASGINAYYPDVIPYCPNFIAFEVTLPRHGVSLTPWTSWTATKPPLWWTAHNKVKHHRDQHFDEATLKNCLNAVAGLFVCVIHLYEQAASNGELLQLPRLFNVTDQHFGGTKMGRYGNSFKYKVR